MLTQAEQDTILSTLSEDQRDFIDRLLTSKRKTAFARELAARKGRYITDSMSD